MPVAKDWRVSGKVHEKKPEFLSTTVVVRKEKSRWDSDLLGDVLQKRRAAKLGSTSTSSSSGSRGSQGELGLENGGNEEEEVMQRFVLTKDGTIEPPRRSRRRANTMLVVLLFPSCTYRFVWREREEC